MGNSQLSTRLNTSPIAEQMHPPAVYFAIVHLRGVGCAEGDEREIAGNYGRPEEEAKKNLSTRFEKCCPTLYFNKFNKPFRVMLSVNAIAIDLQRWTCKNH